MHKVFERLYVGTEQDVPQENMATVHAAKTPFHQQAVGYEKSLPADHPNYLILLNDDDLYCNLVDMPREFLPKFADPIFEAALDFIDNNIETRDVLVRCNQGMSRSPSLAMFWLARNAHISSITYEHAYKEFKELYPAFEPGQGIKLYMTNNWERLMDM